MYDLSDWTLNATALDFDRKTGSNWHIIVEYKGSLIYDGPYRMGAAFAEVRHPQGTNVRGPLPSGSYDQKTLRWNLMHPYWRSVEALSVVVVPEKPSASDVVLSLASDAQSVGNGESFAEWADEMGLSDDSIKARDTYGACVSIWQRFVRNGLNCNEIIDGIEDF